jgi:pimeloyl-ACP methyl ester carboxylesterase
MMPMTRRQFGTLVAALAASGPFRAIAQARPSWETGKMAVPGGNVLWRQLGKGAGLPLLIVHGGHGAPKSANRPDETMFPLGDERRLVTWDQLDCFESDHPANPANWRLARYVEEMEMVRNRLAPGPVHVMGGSWGAVLAMEWLVTKRPRDVASVIFMGAGLDVPRAETSRRRAQERLSPSSRAAFEEQARTGHAPGAALAAAYAEYARTYIVRHPRPEFRGGPPDPAIISALGVDMRTWNRVADLRTLTQPVLFLRGEYDYVTADDVNVAAEACPASQVVTIPDAGHLTMVDNPDATNAAIRRFLHRVEG